MFRMLCSQHCRVQTLEIGILSAFLQDIVESGSKWPTLHMPSDTNGFLYLVTGNVLKSGYVSLIVSFNIQIVSGYVLRIIGYITKADNT